MIIMIVNIIKEATSGYESRGKMCRKVNMMKTPYSICQFVNDHLHTLNIMKMQTDLFVSLALC